jgi:hypothetical protein
VCNFKFQLNNKNNIYTIIAQPLNGEFLDQLKKNYYLLKKDWCMELIDWFIWDWVRDLTVPMHVGPLCPISIYGSPLALPKLQMAPRLIFLMSSGSKKKEPRYTCLSEGKASHSQRWCMELLRWSLLVRDWELWASFESVNSDLAWGLRSDFRLPST